MSNANHSPPTPNKTCKVIVHQARNLIQKGKDNSWNNAFVIIGLGKDKFITSVAEKSQGPRWNEECELAVHKDVKSLELSVLHRGMVLDDFLGQLIIPVGDLETSKVIKRWYKLCNKASKGKKEAKERGDLELTIQLKEDFPATFGTLERSGQRSKAKRSSSLQEKDPVKGIRSKLKLPRLRSHSVVDKDEEWSAEHGALGREKSDSNDSGKASDSLASESPSSSISRLPAPFGSSHDALHHGSTSQSEHSSIATNGTSPSAHRKGTKPSVKKSSSFKKRVKSAVVGSLPGSLKKGKSHSKPNTPNGSLTQLSRTPSVESDEITLQKSLEQDMTLNEIDFLERLRDEDTPATDIAKKNCYRGYIASAVDLHEGESNGKNSRPVSYPMRAISEEHIPLCGRTSRTFAMKDVVLSGGNNNKVVDADGDSMASGTGSQEGSPTHSGRNGGSHFSRDGPLRHSFRSGLPSLKNSTVSVTIDPLTEAGYGTNPCTPKAKAAACKNLDDLPVRYLSLTKEELVRRVVMVDALLTERRSYIKELENYIDNLLLKVMLESPLLLDQDYAYA